jgi:hypothetical protein
MGFIWKLATPNRIDATRYKMATTIARKAFKGLIADSTIASQTVARIAFSEWRRRAWLEMSSLKQTAGS